MRSAQEQLEACAADLPGCDDTADLLGDRADLVLLFAAAIAVIVVIVIVLDRMLRRRSRR